MTSAQIRQLQEQIGTTPDGFWGPKSIAAVQRHLRALAPARSPWPDSSQSALQAFYGSPGDESQLVAISLPDGTLYAGRPVRTTRVHRRCADSLSRILRAIAAGPHADVLRQFAGVYNHRPMRGGTLPSLHARGAAIDLDPDRNGNRAAWPVAATMPLVVMEAFAREGWTPAGAFWGRDAMHFEATKL